MTILGSRESRFTWVHLFQTLNVSWKPGPFQAFQFGHPESLFRSLTLFLSSGICVPVPCRVCSENPAGHWLLGLPALSWTKGLLEEFGFKLHFHCLDLYRPWKRTYSEGATDCMWATAGSRKRGCVYTNQDLFLENRKVGTLLPPACGGGRFRSLPSSSSLNWKFSLTSARRYFCSSSDSLTSSSYPYVHAKAVNFVRGGFVSLFWGRGLGWFWSFWAGCCG